MIKKRGRPLRTELDRMRVQVWFRSVVTQSGKNSTELASQFNDAAKGRAFAPSSLWSKYSRGDASPGHPTYGMGLVERVDAEYPGTGRWYRHALWRALHPDPLTHVELRSLFEMLPQELRSALLHPFPGNRFWRKEPVSRIFLEELLSSPSIDSAACLACIAREAEINQDQLTHELAFQALQMVAADLMADPIMKIASFSLNSWIARAWEGTIYIVGQKTRRVTYDPKCNRSKLTQHLNRN